MADLSPATVVDRWARQHRAAIVYRDLVRCGRCGFWSPADADLCVRCGIPDPRGGSTASPDADALVRLRRSRRVRAGVAGITAGGITLGTLVALAGASGIGLAVAAIAGMVIGERTARVVEKRSLAQAIVTREAKWLEATEANAPRAFETLRRSLQGEIDHLTEQARRLRGEVRAFESAGRGADAQRLRAALRRVEARWSQLRDELDRLDARLARNHLLPWLVALRDGDLPGFEHAIGTLDPGPLAKLQTRAHERAGAAGPRARDVWRDVARLAKTVQERWWQARAEVAESRAAHVENPALDEKLHHADAELDLLVDEALSGPYVDERALLAEAEREIDALLREEAPA